MISNAQYKAKNFGPVFGQSFEDKIVSLAIDSVNSFIDIGANDGISLSNTYYFAENGAEGICFEPNHDVFRLLRRVYKNSNTVVLVNEAIGHNTREAVLYRSGYGGLLSSIVDSPKTKIDNARPDQTKIRPLEYWLELYPQFRTVDLLSIDVEGAEKEVLKGIDFNQFEAKIVIIEIDNPDSREVDDCLQILYSHGYRPFARNQFNCFLSGPSLQVSKARLANIKLVSSLIQVVESRDELGIQIVDI